MQDEHYISSMPEILSSNLILLMLYYLIILQNMFNLINFIGFFAVYVPGPSGKLVSLCIIGCGTMVAMVHCSGILRSLPVPGRLLHSLVAQH